MRRYIRQLIDDTFVDGKDVGDFILFSLEGCLVDEADKHVALRYL